MPNRYCWRLCPRQGLERVNTRSTRWPRSTPMALATEDRADATIVPRAEIVVPRRRSRRAFAVHRDDLHLQ